MPMEAPRSASGSAGRVVLVTGGVRGVGAGISSVFAAAGCHRRHLCSACGRRPALRIPPLRHPRRRRGQGDGRRDRGATRPPRRRGQQRRRLALRLDGGVQREVQPQDHRAQSAWCTVGFPARQRDDAKPAEWRVDRQHLQPQRPPAVTGHRRLRRGQGGPGKPHPDAGGGVGPEGAGERLRGRDGRDRAVGAVLRRCRVDRRDLEERAARAARHSPPMSVGPQRFWPPTRRPTSAAPRSRCTAAANRRIIWPPRTRTRSSRGRHRVWE